jgi:hypothetical protein
MLLRKFCLITLLAGATVFGPGWLHAAPAEAPVSTGADAAADESDAAEGLKRTLPSAAEAAAVEVPSPSKTLRMLLEMQQAPQGPAAASAGGSGRAPAARVGSPSDDLAKTLGAMGSVAADTSASAASAARGIALAPTQLGGVLGGRSATDGAAYGTADVGDRPRSSSGRSSSGLPDGLVDFIEFLREHRAWLIGIAVGTLLLLGLGASVFSQRQR